MARTASPDPRLQDLLKMVQVRSAKLSEYLRGLSVQREWMLPFTDEDVEGVSGAIDIERWEGDLTDPEDINKAFDRGPINEAYNDALNGGNIGECSVHNLQIAYVSVMARAFRARHKTLPRSVTHAAGRRYGHGSDGGIHIGQVLQFIQDLLGGSQKQ